MSDVTRKRTIDEMEANICIHPGECIEKVQTSGNILNLCVYEDQGVRHASICTDSSGAPIGDNLVSCEVPDELAPNVIVSTLLDDLSTLVKCPEAQLISALAQTSQLLYYKLKASENALSNGVYQQADGSVLIILPGVEWVVQKDIPQAFLRACMLFNAMVQVSAHRVEQVDVVDVRRVHDSSSMASCYRCTLSVFPSDSVSCANDDCAKVRHRCCGSRSREVCCECLHVNMFEFIKPLIGEILATSLSKAVKKRKTVKGDWFKSVKLLRPQLNVGDEIKVSDEVFAVQSVKPLSFGSQMIHWNEEEQQYLGDLHVSIRRKNPFCDEEGSWSDKVPIQFFQ